MFTRRNPPAVSDRFMKGVYQLIVYSGTCRISVDGSGWVELTPGKYKVLAERRFLVEDTEHVEVTFGLEFIQPINEFESISSTPGDAGYLINSSIYDMEIVSCRFVFTTDSTVFDRIISVSKRDTSGIDTISKVSVRIQQANLLEYYVGVGGIVGYYFNDHSANFGIGRMIIAPGERFYIEAAGIKMNDQFSQALVEWRRVD